MNIQRLFCAAAAVGLSIPAIAADVSDEAIARAVLPLPESLRAEAGVFTYDEDGERVTLKEGSNQVECKVKDERNHTWCYPVTTAGRRDHSAKLAASGLEGDDLRAAMAKAEADGIIEPNVPGSLLYRLDESEDRIHLLWAVMLPGTMSGDLGITTAGTFRSSVAGKGTPWMMAEGSPMAHLMIPVNGTDLSNPVTVEEALDHASVTDPIAQATLPLPASLRDEAMVVSYDMETGERTTLREGSNSVFCATRNPVTGFTRCGQMTALPESDLRMKLMAEGKSGDEINAAVAAAVEAGEVAPRTFGGMTYRMSEDGLKYLWVLRLPGANAEQTGMPTMPNRDDIMAGKGTPWMMLSGTDRAHLMIPINGTELSNL